MFKMIFEVFLSYLEIYNEQIRDMLSKNTKKQLNIAEDPVKGQVINDEILVILFYQIWKLDESEGRIIKENVANSQ